MESTGYEGAEREGTCDHASMATDRETLMLIQCVCVHVSLCRELPVVGLREWAESSAGGLRAASAGGIQSSAVAGQSLLLMRCALL